MTKAGFTLLPHAAHSRGPVSPCSPSQVRFWSEFLSEFGPEMDQKKHRTPVQSAQQPSWRCVNWLH